MKNTKYVTPLNPAEVFAKVRSARTKTDRVRILKENESPLLKSILQANFKPSVVFEVNDPSKFNPETFQNGQESIPPYRLLVEMKKLLPGATNWPQEKKDFTWFKILESLNKDMSEVFLAMKHKELTKKYRGLTSSVVAEAFPNLNIS